MTNTAIQKKGIGTEIISGLCNYLKQAGFAAIHLSWVKGNPQAEHFWKKNKSIQPFEANVSWFGCAIPLSRQCRGVAPSAWGMAHPNQRPSAKVPPKKNNEQTETGGKTLVRIHPNLSLIHI